MLDDEEDELPAEGSLDGGRFQTADSISMSPIPTGSFVTGSTAWCIAWIVDSRRSSVAANWSSSFDVSVVSTAQIDTLTILCHERSGRGFRTPCSAPPARGTPTGEEVLG